MKKPLTSYFGVLVLVILILPSFWSIVQDGYFPMHDDMQAMRTLQMRKCLLDGQIPCRWVPDMGYGYGYPQFNFYGPLPYYFMAILTFLDISVLDSVKLGFMATIPISAIGMYFLAREFWGKAGSTIAMLLFIYAPYRAVDMYVRGAVGEFWAMSFLPFIFLFTKRLLEGKKHSILGLSLFLSFLFTTHNITSLITLPFLALWALYFLWQNKSFCRKILIKFFVSGIWAIGLAAFYLLPAWFEKKYVHIDTLTMGYFDYRQHFVSLSQLFLRSFWGYGTSTLGPKDEVFLGVGTVHMLFALLALLGALILKHYKYLKSAGFIFMFFVLSIFMAHVRSSFIWRALPILTFVQFPWRFLILASLFISLLGGLIGDLFKAKKAFLALTLFLLAIFNFSFFRPEKIIVISDVEKFSGELWDKQQTISIFDYLPIYAAEPPTEPAPAGPLVEQGSVMVESAARGTNWLSYNLSIFSDEAVVRLPQYYFPKTTLLVNGQERDFTFDNKLGLPTLGLEKGQQTVYLQLTDTSVRIIGNYLTLASGALIIGYWLKLKHA